MILASDEHTEFKTLSDSLKSKSYKTLVNGKSVDVDLDYELLNVSDMHGHEVA